MQLLGLQLHWYGLIIGVSVVLAIQLVLLKAKQRGFETAEIEDLILPVVLAGIIGARLWHVLTDWQIYQNNMMSALYVWQGGLSVLGAVAAGTAVVVYRYRNQAQKLMQLLDISVFGLPFAQAVGRLGNWINQELYGYPTNLPWAIYIAPEKRLPQFSNEAFFHPLFAYEAVGMVLFGVALWSWDAWLTHHKKPSPAAGLIFGLYVAWYCTLRFALDFLRIEKGSGVLGLGINQSVLLVVLTVTCFWLWRLLKKSEV